MAESGCDVRTEFSQVQHGRFTASSRDLDEAHDIGVRTYYPMRLTVFDRSALDFTLEAVRLGPLTLGTVNYSTEICLDAADLDTGYQVNLALSGAMDALCGRQETVITQDTAAVLNPCGRAHMRSWTADTTVLGLKIDRAFLEREIQALTGVAVRAPVSFRMDVDLGDCRHATWLRLLDVLTGLLDHSSTDVFEVLVDRLPEALVSTMLLAVPSNYSESLDTAQDRWEPAAVRRAVQAIEERPEHPWTAKQLAKIAGISVRSLQASFRRIHDRTVFTYLREVRLDRVHAELRRGHRQVSEVAADHGFTNLGRFAGYYHARFGVRPSTTLHSSRSGA